MWRQPLRQREAKGHIMTLTQDLRAQIVNRRGLLGGVAVGSAAIGLGLPIATTAVLADTQMPDPLGLPTAEIDITALPRVRQTLVAPPLVPQHDQVAVGGPKIIEVEMTVKEKRIEIDDEGATIWVFAYDGHVPGPMIIAHQGDYVELTLKSDPGNQMEHNIDFHAATGAMGGGEITMIASASSRLGFLPTIVPPGAR
jgi:nitrite reductase (NO-forming)